MTDISTNPPQAHGITPSLGERLGGAPLPAQTPVVGSADVLGRLGSLTTRLARNHEEVTRAQELRFKVFFEERGKAPCTGAPSNRDADLFDAHCDHLLVLDGQDIVGTYRLLPGNRTARTGGFYSAQEFDLSALTANRPATRLLELGRSCILPAYRNKRTMELLWGGTWAYALSQGATRLFGCGSFEGTQPGQNRKALSLIASSALLDDHEDCDAASAVHQSDRFDLKELGAEPADNPRQALRLLPPLLKGYLRLGARFASTAVIDRAFNTTDVLVVLDVARINPRYINHYGADASRYQS
ncbi:MAG: GNAT family N-acyltransferase [Pseudomonadota bacterium]